MCLARSSPTVLTWFTDASWSGLQHPHSGTPRPSGASTPSGPDLIVAFEDQCVRVAKGATSTIPIVFVHPFDPVAAGYVKSLSRPGGNITGPVSHLDLLGKRLQLLKEINPRLRRVLVLADHRDPFSPGQLELARTAAAVLGIELVEHDTPTLVELERVFAELTPGEIDGVVVASSSVTTNLSGSILALAERARVPFATQRKGWVEKGALFSYASDFPAAGFIAARSSTRSSRARSQATYRRRKSRALSLS